MKPKTLYITYMGLTEPLLQSQALNYLKSLSQKGISVHILSFEKRQFITEGNITSIRKDLERFNIKCFFLKYHKRFQFISKPYDIIRGMLLSLYVTLKEGVEIIHARGTLCALIGLLPFFFLGKKMILDLRGFMAEEYVDAGLWSRQSFFYSLVSRLERYFIRKAHAVIVLTNKARVLLIERDKVKNISIIPSCVDLRSFGPKKGDYSNFKSKYALNEKFVLIYTGSLGSWYMLSEMIDFYKELLSFEDKAVFFILSQAKRAWIERQIPEGLKDRVIIDFTKPENVVDFLNIADVGIFFIKPCYSKMSSSPTKFGEYLACGLPVVINKGIGDTEEIVRNERIGVIVEDFSVAGYRKAIPELKGLLKEGADLKRRCRIAAERYFSLENGTDRYSDIYGRLMHY